MKILGILNTERFDLKIIKVTKVYNKIEKKDKNKWFTYIPNGSLQEPWR